MYTINYIYNMHYTMYGILYGVSLSELLKTRKTLNSCVSGVYSLANYTTYNIHSTFILPVWPL